MGRKKEEGGRRKAEWGAQAFGLRRWLVMGVLLGAGVFSGGAFAEQTFRFPPPEFESGYLLPSTTTPAARALAWQYADVAVLVGALGLASWLALKKRSRKWLAVLSVFSVLYFGFHRQGCVCAIGSIQNVALGLADSGYGVPVTVAAFFLAPLAFALWAGRAFCSAVCPHGALQDLVLLKPVKVPTWLEQGLGVLPYVYLGAAVLFAATGSAFIICRFDPFIPLFRVSGSFLMVSAGIAMLVLAMFVGRPYCRFLCPYGALLRMVATFSKWRVRTTPDVCTQCRLCEEACPYGALRPPATTPTNPLLLARDRRRLGWLVAALPVLLLGAGWLGSRLAVPASQTHPTVQLAEHYSRQQRSPVAYPPQTPESLSLARAERNPATLLDEAGAIRRRFVTGGWLFGAWIGLVIGARLISLSLRRTRTDYEPDRAACVACARCFAACPNERARLGLTPAAPLSAAPTR